MSATIPQPTSSGGGQLTAEQERAIVKSAVRALTAATQGREIQFTASDLNGTAEIPVLGAFVSLKRSGKLRGCCGFLGHNMPLAAALAHSARRTANEDHRFPTVAPRELPHLDVEVWLLSNQQPVAAKGLARREIVMIGKHGLQIARGNERGLLLPGVAVEHGLNAEQFLEHVCLKANLPPTAWREDDTQLWTFEGHAIRSSVAEHLDPAQKLPTPLPLIQRDIPGLVEYCRNNLRAMITGATPSYFALGLPDGNVHGIVMSLLDPAGNEFVQANRLSLKECLPLQSTLFGMTEGLAQAVARMKLPPEQIQQIRLGLAVLCEPALHGTVSQPDLRGLDPRRHAIVVMERNRTAVLFNSGMEAAGLLSLAAQEAGITMPEAAQVFALECLSSQPQVKVVQVPRPAAGANVRAPGVAGRFYPADPRELGALVDRCLAGDATPPQRWPAVMVPHAGLIFSGRIAAQTLRRVEIPSTIIVIGPKHTPYGVEWAVAPQAAWSIPGATIASDPELARRLCEAIPGLQLDAAAHAQEHAIEVEMPFLSRLAPQSKVVGIAIGGGDLVRCRRFASGLAKVIRSLPSPPLLVISSDMNHFASETENRRLDEIALQAMETLDAEQLYKTVTSQHISMCGLLPAVIVMETLRELGQLRRSERVAYDTSASVSGDTSRVVGYAGMLLGA